VRVYNPRYDFDGDALAMAAPHWVRAKKQLSASGSRPPS
jgi:hypothetical protein